ncbi:transcriptional regulator, TetR family [Leptospira broomii serovar Hurstbridge str. 5399]|uniref:Transcriptional regulator, TetR family n=1 Tax=Leptospira broomii serovar Hurstbridge str. 5399 TaxID=1049789 RepID=T0GNX6_9LEPT|nr:TetR/AcrR family transcriptional regulator [Leptospira broomii]EQA47018.1 transcriptional regulator, TetR family [Leptospira broomii serovar Hurstbridge str. 5399]
MLDNSAKAPKILLENKSLSRSRTPLQERSQLRVALVLAAAERILEKVGPEEASIPEIAKQSGVPRASIYQFFPDKYALFTRLAEIHLAKVGEILARKGSKNENISWRKLVGVLVNAASDYYDSTPVAGMLILGGPFSRNAYLAQEVTIDTIGAGVRIQLSKLKKPLHLPKKPDVATLGVEIAFACMKRGYYKENRISKGIREQANNAVTAYFSNWAM